MKKILTILVLGLMVSCGSMRTETGTVTSDSTTVVVDTTIVIDTVKVDTVVTDTVK